MPLNPEEIPTREDQEKALRAYLLHHLDVELKRLERREDIYQLFLGEHWNPLHHHCTVGYHGFGMDWSGKLRGISYADIVKWVMDTYSQAGWYTRYHNDHVQIRAVPFPPPKPPRKTWIHKLFRIEPRSPPTLDKMLENIPCIYFEGGD